MTKLSDNEIVALNKALTFNSAMDKATRDVVYKIRDIARQIRNERAGK